MSREDALRGAGAAPAGTRPYTLVPEVERVLAITMSLAQEVAVLRQRLDTIERLVERGDQPSRAAIDAFEPKPEEAAERALWNQEFVARILRIVQQEGEAAAASR
ncbi:MAG TPA: hypothetical protein VN222_16680 [Novosphingobium sp.]|nr:hypothetical protein [Novosphingobium sp.]